MTLEAIYWALLCGLAGWCWWQQRWISAHHKGCHSESMAAAAALEQRVRSLEEECARLAVNAHNDRSTLGACVLDVARLERRA